MIKPIKKIMLFAVLFWVIGVVLTIVAFMGFSSLFQINFEEVPEDLELSLTAGESRNLYLCSRGDYPVLDHRQNIVFLPTNEASFSYRAISTRLKVGDTNPLFCEGLYRIESKVDQAVSLSWKHNNNSDYFLGVSRPLGRPVVAVISLILISLVVSWIAYRQILLRFPSV